MSKTVLSVHDGHTATAALVRDGKILACISEERLNKIKEWGGVPKLAIKECMRISGVSPQEIDVVTIPSFINPVTSMESGRKSIPRRAFGQASKLTPKSVLRSDKWVKPAVSLLKKFRHTDKIEKVLNEAGIKAPISFCDHHLAHAAGAYFPSWLDKKKRCLVITADGSGDAISGTVNIAKGNYIERMLSISNYNSIGELYSKVTEYLGMKPLSHEFKVMGLAPYSKQEHIQKPYRKFKKMIRINPDNPLMYENISGAWKWQYIDKFKKEFAGERFDNIAGGLQLFFEELVTTWVKNIIEETGIHNVAFGGGVFMNVKTNQKILELPEVKNMFVLPSCGDESLPIGAALQQYVSLCQEDGVKPRVSPLGPLYLGPEYNNDEIKDSIKKASLGKKFKVDEIGDIDGHIGQMAAKGEIIARSSGRCEWGARALGNRSIIADARRRDVVRKINEAVKNRDFWMPFAPSIKAESEKDYIINKKKMKAPYMVVSFDTTDKGRKTLAAAIHPYDFTARPQVVEKSWNPGYHRVLSSFEKETGEGGFMNTSFNLHGYPIACSPEDAIWTLRNTGLEHLALGNFIISKK